MLAAAGFQVASEVKAGAKNTDIEAVWTHEELEGQVRYLVETKHYDKALSLALCTEFVTQYGAAIQGGLADRAFLISHGPIAPAGRAFVRQHKHLGLQCFTFEEFQRRILRIDGLLRETIALYERLGVDNYYIPSKTAEGADLENELIGWIEGERGPPTIIFGGYGIGKTTLALHLCYILAKRAQVDPARRVPVLVALGDIYDEQSIEGLISRTMASRYHTGNYHFQLFSELNHAGRFVIVFDGFDEMKHGMTPVAFQKNFAELLKLDSAEARIVLLGRPTIFESSSEFDKVVHGRSRTELGNKSLPQERRSFIEIRMREFERDEAITFVRKYYPHCVAKERNFSQEDETRLQQLLGPDFESLLSRPIHAKMLCEVATNLNVNLSQLNKLALYDQFVDHLIERETQKRGRSDFFSSQQRRAVNVAVAWWLLSRTDDAPQEEVPTALLLKAIGNHRVRLDELSVRRELLVGCLIEKDSGGRVYFPHYSILEFLASEYMFNVGESDGGFVELSENIALINAEIAHFLIDRIMHTGDPQRTVQHWFRLFVDARMRTLKAGTVVFLKELAECAGAKLQPRKIRWHFWGHVLVVCGGTTTDITATQWKSLLELYPAVVAGSDFQSADGILALLWCFARMPDSDVHATAQLISAIGSLGALLDLLAQRPTGPITIERPASLGAWLTALCLSVSERTPGQPEVSINFRLFAQILAKVIPEPIAGVFDVIAKLGLRSCPSSLVVEYAPKSLTTEKRSVLSATLSSERQWNRLRPIEENDDDTEREDEWQGIPHKIRSPGTN
jgi:NACHT domain